MSGWEEDKKPNRRYRYCAEAARKLLCEAYGLKVGDKIPPADDLLAEARRLAALNWDEVGGDPSNNLKRWDSAHAALAILDEIGGLFEPDVDAERPATGELRHAPRDVDSRSC